jgi:hypothetical protein
VGSRIPDPYGYGGIPGSHHRFRGDAPAGRQPGLIDGEPWSDRLGSGRSGVINAQSAHTLDSRIFLKVEDLDAGKP